MSLLEFGMRAKAAARTLAKAGAIKEKALLAAAEALVQQDAAILAANEQDMMAAKAAGMSEAMQDRLLLTKQRIASMAQGVQQVALAKDPVGILLEGGTLPSGIAMEKQTVPMGVIGIIYESRPNVTADCAALCLKAGSAVILRGGKEAYHSNYAIASIMTTAVEAAGLPANSIQLISDLSRESATALMGLTGYIDLLIPRGGAGLIRTVVENAKVPVIETGVGNCHIYVDETADLDMAVRIVINAKTTRPSVCNAAESLLVHKNVAPKVLPLLASALEAKGVQLRVCPKAFSYLPHCRQAVEADWETEFLDYIMAVRIVESLEEATDHIAQYSSGHSEAIVTQSYDAAQGFIQEVDSAAVYVNASTRFTDGSAFGLGAEIGISTQKLHARGPMGLAQLVSTKYILRGNGQIR